MPLIGLWIFATGMRLGPVLLWKLAFLYKSVDVLVGLGWMAVEFGNASMLLLTEYVVVLPLLYGLWRMSFAGTLPEEIHNKSIQPTADSGG